MEKISTPLTPFFKFAFSTTWFLFFFLIPDTEFPMIILIIFFPVFAFWEYSRIKKVEIDGDYLYVSNYLRSLKVPLENIESISDNIWLQSHTVTIYLKEPCVFGKKIVFMPRLLLLFYQHHPIVEELKNIIDAKEFRQNSNQIPSGNPAPPSS